MKDYAPFLDILDGAAEGKIELDIGHGAEYWQKSDDLLFTEVFANIGAASITNPKALEIIKKHFKQTYQVFEKMIVDF